MKKYFLFICILIMVSCGTKENVIIEKVSAKNTAIERAQTIDRPKHSKIIKTKYNLNLLFGVWTYDPKGPHADFELTKKSFYVVDYDGNADMPYIINQDTIRVHYNDYVSVGIIKNATKDTLKINWDENGITNYVKWKG